VPRGGVCAQMVVGMLYNAFGLCIWCVVVCGHCVLDLSCIGVMFASWWLGVVNVENAGWLQVAFFFVFGVCILTLVDAALASFWGLCVTLCFGVRLFWPEIRDPTTQSVAVLDRLG